MSNPAPINATEVLRRPLSGLERLVWVMTRRTPLNFVVTLRLRGPFSLESFRRAVRAVRSEYRGLAARIALDSDGRPTYEHDDQVPEFAILERKAETDHGWREETVRQLTEPFDSHVGPLARFVVLCGDGYVDLLAVCDHGVADGLSAVNLLRDVCRRMTPPDEPPQELPLPPSTASAVTQEIINSIEVRRLRRWGPLFLRVYNFCREVKRRVTFQSRPDLSPYGDHPRSEDLRGEIEKRRARVLSWCVPTELSGRLTERCRREGTTIQSALCVAFARAYCASEAFGPARTRRVQSPVSVRKWLQPPVVQGAGLYNLLLHTNVDCRPSSDFWTECRAFRKRLENDIRPEKLFGGIVLIEDVFRRAAPDQFREAAHAMLQMKVHHDLSISNLGRLDMPTNFGPLVVESVHGPAVLGQDRAPVLGVATLGDRMTFTLTAQASAGDDATILGIVEQALQTLRDAAG